MINVDTRHIDNIVSRVRDPECRRRAYLAAAGIRRQFASDARDAARETEHLSIAAAYEKRAEEQ